MNDMFAESQGGSSWEDVDSYTLAKIYSENVKHQLFNPVSDQSLVWEMDRLNAVRNAGGYVDPKKWAALAATLFITFGPDGGSGGGGAGYTNDWYRSTFPSAGASAQYHWNKHGSQWSSIEGYTQAAKDFYSTNINLAKPWPIKNGQEMGVKITTRDYFGIYTTDGRIVTFGPR